MKSLVVELMLRQHVRASAPSNDNLCSPNLAMTLSGGIVVPLQPWGWESHGMQTWRYRHTDIIHSIVSSIGAGEDVDAYC